ncbi:MYG1 exonuclease isoform X2 [Nematostella vectensis]|uniref:MYG1 exonuclease isoform X2 n=1 Tax=Nematostella vectensis TaxID=45351 RepID=UPI002077772E|nr:MYG1 exonuclease isoform X2 [Nematostella vectensis]
MWFPVSVFSSSILFDYCKAFLRSQRSRGVKIKYYSIMAEVKKVCTSKKIGTHNGTFHCDEVLACYMLKQLPEYSHADIIRTRDPKILEQCDVVVDVSGVYDASKHRYDHHQRSFTGCMQTLTDSQKPWKTKLSSAGLVYLHFGRRVLSQVMQMPEDHQALDKVYDKIYENLIQEVDAIDNGVSQSDEKPRYIITTNLSARVGNLNPKWNDKNMDEEAQFNKALQLVGGEFMDKVLYYKNSWLPARSLVKGAVLHRFEVDESGEIAELAECGCPWKDHLFDLEKELNIECVSVRPQSFENRLGLLEEWRGIRDDALSKLSGIQGCIFVHATGFIGGNQTRKGALEMARKTLQKSREAMET